MPTIFKLLDTETKVLPPPDDGSGARQVEVICSTATPDRIGDVIVQEGIDIGAFKKNPVVLWGHDSDRPIARADTVYLQNGQLRAIAEFPPEGKDPDADWAYSKVKNRLVNAVSIGFIPKEWEPVDPKNPWDGYKYLESEMVEFSFVSVPMNAEALVVGRSLVPPKRREFMLPSQQRALPLRSRSAGDDPEPDADDDDWQVGASKSLPIASDGEWDGADASQGMFEGCGFGGDEPDYASLRKGFLLHNAAKPEQKSSYLLPIGKMIDGKMTAHQTGLEEAASKLSKAAVPEEVRGKAQGVVDHYKARLESEGKQFITRATDTWKVGAARDLAIDESDGWDSPAAAKSILDAAGFDGDSPDTGKARKGFLIYDSANPEVRSSYKLPFATVVDGALKAVKGGIRAAASRLPQTDAPADMLERARSVVDHYEARMGSDSEDGKAMIAALHRTYRALDETLARMRKSGRVLSVPNEERLRSAHAAIGEVLEQLPPPDEGTAANDASGKEATHVRREADVSDLSPTKRFPRRAEREVELLKLRA